MDTTRLRLVHWLGSDGAPRAVSPCLVVIAGPDLGRKIPLEDPTLTVGRDVGCEVVVPVDGISRAHCRIEVRNGVWLRDLQSTNGTWLNGQPVPSDQALRLQSGDRIELVGVVFKFLDGSDIEAQYHEEIYQLTIVDGLTRAYNRRYLLDFLAREISRCRRHQRPLSLLLFDVDRFKEINDRHGHAAGDSVLRRLVAVVSEAVRREECLARYGGDEFAIVMPETELEGARIVAERTRGRVETTEFTWAGARLPVTLSAGLRVLGPELVDPEELIAEADARLYEAKAAGRNRVAG
jgi:two-component system cell cycle response regulator